MKFIHLIVNNYGMTGVIPALEAHNKVRFTGEKISYLALTFITPLGTNNNGYLGICDRHLISQKNSWTLLCG